MLVCRRNEDTRDSSGLRARYRWAHKLAAASGLIIMTCFSSIAGAESGDGIGAGPVFVLSHPIAIGWEVSGAWKQGPVTKFAVGGSYRISPEWPNQRNFHYVAWEPWLGAGVTLGAALTNEAEVRPLYGLWEGMIMSLQGKIYDQPDYDRDFWHWAFSVSVGWRGLIEVNQIYITPKVWRIVGWDAFS